MDSPSRVTDQTATKGRELKNDERTSITSGVGVSCLLLQNITTDDSGKYDVCVMNPHGEDSNYASVAVEGPPDPPSGTPCITTSLDSVSLTWSSSPYDGGKIVNGFSVEYSMVGSDIWTTAVEECHSLSYVVRGLQPGGRYVFRVRAFNVHGYSRPSLESDIVQLEEHNECSFFEPRIVSVEPGPEFKTRYEVLEELGKGRYGVVHKVVDKETNQKLAAKFIKCRTSKDRDKVQDEIDIMNLLRHQKLLQLAAAYENPRDMVMVMEYISGGELFERVVADDFTLTEKDCILFMRQICEGVAYMHSQSVVHLDLKPENIMCHTRTSHEIKIIDFGLAQKINPQQPIRVLFGTPEFIPPEIISYEPIGVESDMWSIGVICYVLLSGLSPFMGDNDSETFTNITRAEYDFEDEAFNTVSQNARDFIGALLIKRKEDRLSAEQCLKHVWLDPETHQQTVVLCTDKLKKFIIRRKWQKTGNAIRALGRMATLSASRRNSANSAPNTPRPSISGNSMPRMSSLNEEDINLNNYCDISNFTEETNKNHKDVEHYLTEINKLAREDSRDETEEENEPKDETKQNEEAKNEDSPTEPSVVPTESSIPVKSIEDLKKENCRAVKSRACTDRSDSGFSDCSTLLPSSTSTPLLSKKFCINEENEPNNEQIYSSSKVLIMKNYKNNLNNGNTASPNNENKTVRKDDVGDRVERSHSGLRLNDKIENFTNQLTKAKPPPAASGLKRLPIYTSRTVAGTIRKFDSPDVPDNTPIPKSETNHIKIKSNGKFSPSIETTPPARSYYAANIKLDKNSQHTSRVEQIKEKLSSNEKLNNVSPTVKYRSPSPSLLKKTQAVIAKEQSNEFYVNKHGKQVQEETISSTSLNKKNIPKSDSFRRAAAFWNSPNNHL